MTQNWEIVLDTQEERRKVALLEGRVRQAGDPDADEVEFFLTIYPDQVSLNVPASTAGQEFIASLTDLLGPPKVPPTIKCSCSWGQGIMGAMVLVLWDLPRENPAPLRNLRAFLGARPVA
jgi:hypothetical protein